MFNDDSYQTAIREIKTNGHHMRKALEGGNMKETLKYTREMLTNLSVDIETRSYYSLFILCFDELSHFQQNLEEVDFSKKKYNLYETVQYSKTILPRIYLLISVGNVLIQQNQKEIMDFLNDVFRMCKGIQHPCRGLFIRYYLLKTFKTIFQNPSWQQFAIDKKQELLEFLVKNFREMNQLWIRIHTLIDDKIIRKKQREDLGYLVADNLAQISSMPGMSLDFYKEQVLQRVLDIILENQDKISQSYLFDVMLKAFPADYHIPTLDIILKATEKIYKKVNINNIYLNLMDRFTEFAKNKSETELEQFTQSVDIYQAFKQTLKSIFAQKKYSLPRCLNLISGFMKFTTNFYHKNKVYINEILKMTKDLCDNSEDEKLESKSIKFLEDILSTPLESLSIMILNIDEFPKLMDLLPFKNKKIVVQKISIAIVSTRTYLVNQAIVDKLMIFIKPLFEKENQSEIEEFSNILHFIESPSPRENLQMLETFFNETNKEYHNHIKYFYPIYVYRCLNILSRAALYQKIIQEEKDPVIEDEEQQESSQPLPSQSEILNNFIKANFVHLFNPPYLSEKEKQNFSISKNDYILDFEKILDQLHRVNFDIEIESPLISMQIYLDLSQILNTFPNNENIDQLIYSCFSRISSLFQNDIGVEREREFYFEKILSYLKQITHIHPDTYHDILSLFQASISLLGDRSKQAKGNLKISKLLLGDQFALKNTLSRSIKCVKMASRFDPKSLVIYVHILDYILEYIYRGLICFTNEEIEQILHVIDISQQQLTEQQQQKFIHQKTQVIDYWYEKITDQELKGILKPSKQFNINNGKKFQSKN